MNLPDLSEARIVEIVIRPEEGLAATVASCLWEMVGVLEALPEDAQVVLIDNGRRHVLTHESLQDALVTEQPEAPR